MPQIGEDKKPTGQAKKDKSTWRPNKKEEDDTPIVSAYTEEGQERMKQYEAAQKKKAHLVAIISISVMVIVLVGLIVWVLLQR